MYIYSAATSSVISAVVQCIFVGNVIILFNITFAVVVLFFCPRRASGLKMLVLAASAFFRTANRTLALQMQQKSTEGVAHDL